MVSRYCQKQVALSRSSDAVALFGEEATIDVDCTYNILTDWQGIAIVVVLAVAFVTKWQYGYTAGVVHGLCKMRAGGWG